MPQLLSLQMKLTNYPCQISSLFESMSNHSFLVFLGLLNFDREKFGIRTYLKTENLLKGNFSFK